MDVDLIRQVLAALEHERAEYVVFGAVALALHGLLRATEDLDLFIAPNRDNIERVKAALRSVFHDPSIDEITADDCSGSTRRADADQEVSRHLRDGGCLV